MFLYTVLLVSLASSAPMISSLQIKSATIPSAFRRPDALSSNVKQIPRLLTQKQNTRNSATFSKAIPDIQSPDIIQSANRLHHEVASNLAPQLQHSLNQHLPNFMERVTDARLFNIPGNNQVLGKVWVNEVLKKIYVVVKTSLQIERAFANGLTDGLLQMPDDPKGVAVNNGLRGLAEKLYPSFKHVLRAMSRMDAGLTIQDFEVVMLGQSIGLYFLISRRCPWTTHWIEVLLRNNVRVPSRAASCLC